MNKLWLRHKKVGRSAIDDVSFSDRIFLAIENPVLRRELLTALRSNKAFTLQFIFLAALAAVVYLAWPDKGLVYSRPSVV